MYLKQRLFAHLLLNFLKSSCTYKSFYIQVFHTTLCTSITSMHYQSYVSVISWKWNVDHPTPPPYRKAICRVKAVWRTNVTLSMVCTFCYRTPKKIHKAEIFLWQGFCNSFGNILLQYTIRDIFKSCNIQDVHSYPFWRSLIHEKNP